MDWASRTTDTDRKKRDWRAECRGWQETDPAKYRRVMETKHLLCDGILCPDCFGATVYGCPVCHGDGWDPNSTAESRAQGFKDAAARIALRVVR